MMRPTWTSRAITPLVLAAGLGLAGAVLSVPDASTGLRPQVDAALADSGSTHPVTAVLLNFRAYDTLLEIAVLLLALVGAWSLRLGSALARECPAGPVLTALVKTLIPLMVVVAGHLLWLGSKAPGGAFQAGAVLAAAGVLLRLARQPLPAWRHPLWFRALASAGLLVFLTVAVAMMRDGRLLEYRGGQAGQLIVVIEAAAAVSIGAVLAALFVARAPDAPRGPT